MQFPLSNTKTFDVEGKEWTVPASDKYCTPVISREVHNLMFALDFLRPSLGVAIQAGGNVGFYPLRLAERFRRVYTFEPEPINFKCLLENLERHHDLETHGLVIPFNAALGNKAEQMGITQNEEWNTGTYRLVQGTGTKVLTIDDMRFDSKVGLIQLDVEGYELFALQGAQDIIERDSPAIVIELNGLSRKFGHTDEDVKDWLADRGYEMITRFGRDHGFIRTRNDKEDRSNDAGS